MFWRVASVGCWSFGLCNVKTGFQNANANICVDWIPLKILKPSTFNRCWCDQNPIEYFDGIFFSTNLLHTFPGQDSINKNQKSINSNKKWCRCPLLDIWFHRVYYPKITTTSMPNAHPIFCRFYVHSIFYQSKSKCVDLY